MLVVDGVTVPFYKLLILLSFVLFSYSALSNNKANQPTPTWLTYCPNEQLCFQRPSNLHPENVENIGATAGQLTSDNINLIYDLGWYATKFPELTKASIESIMVDGRQAQVIQQGKKLALTIASVSGKIRFAMLIEFKNTIERQQGIKIFKSIKFNLQHESQP